MRQRRHRDYTLRDDGRVEVVNRCRTADGTTDEAKGVARVAGRDGSNARLEVRFAPAFLSFLPMVWGDYWIIDLAADYSTAVVGSPDREYLWLLARAPSVEAHVYDRMVDAARREGFETAKLELTKSSHGGGTRELAVVAPGRRSARYARQNDKTPEMRSARLGRSS